MYHRNILTAPAARYTSESPLVIDIKTAETATFISSAVPFSAEVRSRKTYRLQVETHIKGDKTGRSMRLFVVLDGKRTYLDSERGGTFQPSADGTCHVGIECLGAGVFEAWNFSIVEGAVETGYAPNPDAVDAGGGEIKIYRPKSAQDAEGGSALGIFPLTESATHKMELMGSDTITLSWDDECGDGETPLSIPLGAYIIVDGVEYRCLTPYAPQQTDELIWHYEPEFHSPVSALSVKPFFFYMEDLCETDFSINGEFKEFTDALAKAILKSTGETWDISAPDDLGTRVLTFSQTDILDAIGTIADEFGVEWLAAGRSIRFVKDASSSDTRTLIVGSDIAAPSSSGSDAEYFNRYYAFGSTRNIVRTDYGQLNASVTSLSEPRLKLPTAQWTDEDGELVPGCPGGYVDYHDGSSSDYAERNACVKVYDDIYPQSDLVITSVKVTSKKDENGEQYPVYTIKSKALADGSAFEVNNSTYDKDGNPSGQLISGLNISVNFTSGLLQGKEFEVALSADGLELTIVPDTSEEIMVPNNLILPKVGDKLIVFNIRMPDSYRLKAEQRLYKKLMEDIAKAHSESAAMTLTSYPDAGITSLAVGDRLLVKNGSVETTTRIVGIEQCLDLPAQWTVTTGEAARTSKVHQMTEEVGKLSGAVAVADKSAARAARAAWKSSQELLDQVFDPDGDFFTERIKPLVVETANVTVGTKSQQFVIENLVFGFSNGEAEATAPYFFAKARNTSTTPAIHHYAIDPDGVRTWRLDKSYTLAYGGSIQALGAVFEFTAESGGCYIYAVCPRFDGVEEDTELNGRLMLSDRQILAEPAEDKDNYYFLLGMLSSEISDNGHISRNVTLTNGETTINGGNITTGRIRSAGGDTWFDLDTGEIHGNITLTANEGNTSLINSIIEGNDTVISGAAAASVAASAKAAADEALTAAEGVAADKRNWLLDSARKVTLTVYSFNMDYHWDLVSGAVDTVFPENDERFVWISYYVDAWTQNYFPTAGGWNLGGSPSEASGWGWWNGAAQLDSGYIQVTASTRRYWYKGRAAGFKLRRCWLYTSDSQNLTPKPTIYNVMLSFGKKLADYTPAPVSLAYLREALGEAAASSTSISGGLVLSKFIGVRNSSSVIVAGMSGAELAAEGSLPMMWAGAKANTDAGVEKAAFRVYNNGHVDMGDVSISQGSDTKKLTIANGAVTSLNGAKKSVFSSDTMGTMAAAVSSSASTKKKTITAGKKFLFTELIETTSKNVKPIGKSGDYILASHTTSKAAAVTLPAFSAEFTVDTDDISHGISKDCRNETWIESSISIVLSIGSTRTTLASAKLRDYNSNQKIVKTAISVASQNFTVNASTSIKLSAVFSVNGEVHPWEERKFDQDDSTTEFWNAFDDAASTNEVTLYFSSAVSLTITEGEYRNSYFADGFFLQSASTRYAGINSFDSTTLMQMRSNNAILKFTNTGLHQSLNGSDFYRGNPLVYAVKFVWRNSQYSASQWMNPLNLGMKAERSSQGKIKVTHNFGKASYFPVVQALEGTYWLFAQVAAVDNNSVTIWRIDRDGHFYDGAFYLFLYDITTFNK